MMMEFLTDVPLAPEVRPAFNIGGIYDIPTGSYVRGLRGNWVLFGGSGYLNSVVGPGNSFKTDEILTPVFIVQKRYKSVRTIIHDAENSLKYPRLHRIAKRVGLENPTFFGEDPLFKVVQRADMESDAFFEKIKELRNAKQKAGKAIRRTIPALDDKGTPIIVKAAHQVVIDSLSAASSKAVVEGIVEKNSLGDAKNQTQFMKDGLVKTQLMTQLPNMSVQGDIHFYMTAHIGTFIQIDPYAPKPMGLTFTPNGKKMKSVPEKFQYHNDILYDVINSKPLLDSDKKPAFPKEDADKNKGNDLFLVTAISNRNKSGPSGVLYPNIYSQAEGKLTELIMLNYLREVGKKEGPAGIAFGIEGNLQRYSLCMRPEVTFQRTTARKLLEDNNDHRLINALEHTTELLLIKNLWRGHEDWWVAPEDMYRILSEKGYDWDVLLNTRNYWVYEEDREGELPELTTKDLCEMCHDRYYPFFLDPNDKTKLKEGMYDEEGRLTSKGFKKGL